MQLVFVAHRCRAAFEITDITIVLGYDERALELSRVAGVDAEIRTEFHRAAHALRDIDKRAVGKHRRIERGKEIVAIGHDRSEVFLHQFGMLFHRLANRAENHAHFRQFFLERRLHTDRVHNGIDRRVAAQRKAFFEGNSEFVKRFFEFRVDFSVAFWLLRHRVCIIRNPLIINLRQRHVRPVGLFHRQPMAERLQAELQQPFRLVFLRRNQPYNILVQTLFDDFRLNVRRKAELILLFGNPSHQFVVRFFRFRLLFLLRHNFLTVFCHF